MKIYRAHDSLLVRISMSLPQNEQQAYQRATNAFYQGKFAEALQQFNTLVRQFPNEAKTHFAVGMTWSELGEREKAIKHIEKAAGLSFDLPNNSNPYSKIANIVSLSAKNKERRLWLDRALEWAIASESPLLIARAKYDLAIAEDNVEDSLRYVKEALTFAPNDIDLLTYLSAVLIEMGGQCNILSVNSRICLSVSWSRSRFPPSGRLSLSPTHR